MNAEAQQHSWRLAAELDVLQLVELTLSGRLTRDDLRHFARGDERHAAAEALRRLDQQGEGR